MNEKSEQIDSGLNYVIDHDQPLDWRSGLFGALAEVLGENFAVVSVRLSDGVRKVAKYSTPSGVVHYFLLAAVTFLGGNGNHPIFKKRIQLKPWFKDAYYQLRGKSAMVHFMGVYHYNGNVIFVDFEPETYIGNLMHNSSAFVYTNDLYRAMKDGVAFRRDFNGHGITTISRNKFCSYINAGKNVSTVMPTADLVEAFKSFNSTFPFLKWIRGIDAIREMADNNWPDWRQTEWAGWFLEYKFSTYIEENGVTKIVYCKNKKKNDLLDFDLWFPHHRFYGDLKASDEIKELAPGNDQETFMEALNRHDRFWYVVFEHETIKDSDSDTGHKFAVERAAFILTKDGTVPLPSRNKRHRDLKYKICFNRMLILEINRFNYQDMLKTFNQGRQPDGKPRAKKFLVRKHLPAALENYQVLHYAPSSKRDSGSSTCSVAGQNCLLRHERIKSND